jgi:hypothetical protein
MKPVRTAIITLLSAILSMVATEVKGVLVNTVSLKTPAFYTWWGGGEFTATFSSSALQNATVALYNPEALGSGGWETFCVEVGVDFNANQPYAYTFGDVSQGTPAAGAGLALTQGTAWLYYQFATGGLSDFNYSTLTPLDQSQRGMDDNLLQAAIWALQGGQTYGNYTVPTVSNNIFYQDVITRFGSLAAAQANYTGDGVEFLQMTDDSGAAAQNQLVLVSDSEFGLPVPDGGPAAGLLGLSLFGLFVVECGRGKFSRCH